MIKILRLDYRQAEQEILRDIAGAVKKIEVYASASVSGGKVQLKKKIGYLDGVYEYVDTIPAAGTTVASAKTYQLPLTYTNVDASSGETVETEVPVSQGGLELYATLDDDTINGFRNGYWDLAFQDTVLGSDPEQRSWTLTQFHYVEGVKTTIVQYTGTSDRGATPDTLTLKHTASLSEYDEITLTLATADDEPISVADNYCSGSVNTRVAWERKTRTQTTDLATVTLDANGVGLYEPKDSDSGTPYYLATGDKLVYTGGDDDMKALTILAMVEQ